MTNLFADESHNDINQYINGLATPGIEGLLQEGREVIASESSGGMIPVLLTIAPLKSSGKLCAVIRDMTSWKQTEQEQAWIGDCILELFARSWILENHGKISGEMAIRMTSNQFLANTGNPTAIEAKIGVIYETEGLEAAFSWIDQELLPLFKKQEKKRR